MRALNYEFENHNGLQLIISANPMFEFHQLNQFELNMLRQNRLQHFLICETEVIDNEYKFHYNVHGYKKLQQYMQVRCTTQLDLYQFTSQLIDAIKSSFSSMLTPDGCLIHMETLFYDEQSNQILLTYLPVQHKDKLIFSLLQWFLYWSNQVQITDSAHLQRMFTYFIEQNFSLERIQEVILDYLYTARLSNATDVPLIPNSGSTYQETLSSNMSNTPQSEKNTITTSHLSTIQSIKNMTDPNPSASKEALTFDDESNSLIVLDEHKPNKLRVSLYMLILLCIPLAIWLKLFLPYPTTTNLLLSIGVTLLVLSAQIYIYSKMVQHSKLKDDVIDDSLFAEDTGEHHPPYHFMNTQTYEHNQSATANEINGESVKTNQINTLDKIVGNRQLDTVKLGVDNATVQLGKTGLAHAYVVRMYNGQEQRYEIGAGECIVGRSIDGVHINDSYAGVSRLHIQFEYKNGLVIAKDLGSRNGSYLNQTQLIPYKNYIINEQDSIQLVDKDGPIYKIIWA